ncbi:hypothetical protein CKN82_11265 [Carnobacterium divergens]|nr:hypothetical protein [Carnobacterium divergens]TFI66665.1 hypothetical protein CKN70_11420 [Carnobacterium divergens]TFI78959.1 hypothetical protein CKN68_11380 [Carnobacterium divergens]TFI86099.1 hypothetical protein CKN72_11145 [Carnobacterium divergens]TFI95318.1 hypothetical protein CKN67_11385 [Carnobacterium divergens]TFI96380.1 hypothetical protein CKN82_11265 [Carnobacterium divergens]
MTAKNYVIQVGNMYFKGWGEDPLEPVFLLPDAVSHNKFVRRFTTAELPIAEKYCDQFGGEIKEVLRDDRKL